MLLTKIYVFYILCFMSYNRQKAVEYAFKWWNNRNPQFYNFDSLGGDCTNFINQCLNAGGIVMDNTVNTGWFYKSLNYRSPSWSGVNEFLSYALNNKLNVGVKAKVVPLTQLEIGDIIQMRQNPARFNHTLLVTKIDNTNGLQLTPNNIYVTAHTFDVKDKKLSLYNYEQIKCLKVLN